MTGTIIVFLAGIFIDVFYVGWIKAIGRGLKLPAAIFSMAIGTCGLVGVTSVITNPWQSIPYLLGLGAGTVVGMTDWSGLWFRLWNWRRIVAPGPGVIENQIGTIVVYRPERPDREHPPIGWTKP